MKHNRRRSPHSSRRSPSVLDRIQVDVAGIDCGAGVLRVAAMSLARSQTALGAFYRRLAVRIGKPKALTATARKLAILVYRTLTGRLVYRDPGAQTYTVRRLRQRADTLGLTLVNRQAGEVLGETVSGSSQGSVQLWPVPWLISQTLSSTYVAGEHRLYLERNCRLSENPAHGTRRKSRGACQFQGAEQSARVRPSGKTSAKVQAAFHECSWFVAL